MVVLINLFLFHCHLPPLSFGIFMHIIIVCFHLSNGTDPERESDTEKDDIGHQHAIMSSL